MTSDLLRKIDNTVLDLEASHYQTYEALLQKLARLLRHDELQVYNEKLIHNVNLNDFLNKSFDTQSGMVGSACLEWTENDDENLALQYLLIQKFKNSEMRKVLPKILVIRFIIHQEKQLIISIVW